jgi:conserved oligomeric Golgi complex subunit 6
LNRQNIVTIFLAKFTLTDTETEAMTLRDVPVGRRVFDAMDRCEQIKEDCRYLTPDGVETKAG